MIRHWQCHRLAICSKPWSASCHTAQRCAISTRWSLILRRSGFEHGTKIRGFTSLVDDADAVHLKAYSESLALPDQGCDWVALEKLSGNGEIISLHGYVGNRKKISKSLIFQRLSSPDLKKSIQLVCVAKPNVDGQATFPSVATSSRHSAVTIHGVLRRMKVPSAKNNHQGDPLQQLEVEVSTSTVLNAFPQTVMLTEDKVYRPDERHLEIRGRPEIREALLARSEAASIVRQIFLEHDFVEIDTPILFKSTPEGAREFLVPTRLRNRAYALPQSPQQYKQILMASGLPRYFQIARCFRDEDLRIDRQPEFTQIDYELAFADESAVKDITETLISRLWARFHPGCNIKPSSIESVTYKDAMAKYGSDKPDRRYGMEIIDITHLVQGSSQYRAGERVELITFGQSYNDVRKNDRSLKQIINGIRKNFGKSAQIEVLQYNKDQSQGLASNIVEADILRSLGIQHNSFVVIMSEIATTPTGGWTTMGRVRDQLHRELVEHGFQAAPKGFDFLWVVDFPLFSPLSHSEPGQGGKAGLSSTHHPFTAPKTQADLELLSTDPLSVTAAHYDLVVNGVELGGGSRRIHNSYVQEHILRHVLQVPEAGIASLRHLIDALKAGCPPHAGMALGFDRLLAVLLGRPSVRDVIAFPKNNRGEDLLVGSPNTVRPEQLEPYYLSLIEQDDVTREAKALKDNQAVEP